MVFFLEYHVYLHQHVDALSSVLLTVVTHRSSELCFRIDLLSAIRPKLQRNRCLFSRRLNSVLPDAASPSALKNDTGTWIVPYTDIEPDRFSHEVDVTAATLYEAAVFAVVELRRAGLFGGPHSERWPCWVANFMKIGGVATMKFVAPIYSSAFISAAIYPNSNANAWRWPSSPAMWGA